MALRRTLSRGFFTQFKLPQPAPSGASLNHVCRTSDDGVCLRRFFQFSFPADHLSLPVGDKMMERIHGSMRPDLAPPKKMPAAGGLSHEETRKVLRATQMELARARLRSIPRSCISYSEFLTICGEDSINKNGINGIARALDESGSVIVLGDVVFLRPELIAGAIERLISPSKVDQNDPKRRELKEMEDMKADIDRNAEALVKRELWGGLGLLLLQTAGFMRLTFWDLSWDVMEPLCFFGTSMYFIACYAFFLRTSRDPSLERFFQSRFQARQKQLMKTYKFDVNKFNELQRAHNVPSRLHLEQSTSINYDCHRRSTFLGDI